MWVFWVGFSAREMIAEWPSYKLADFLPKRFSPIPAQIVSQIFTIYLEILSLAVRFKLFKFMRIQTCSVNIISLLFFMEPTWGRCDSEQDPQLATQIGRYMAHGDAYTWAQRGVKRKFRKPHSGHLGTGTVYIRSGYIRFFKTLSDLLYCRINLLE